MHHLGRGRFDPRIALDIARLARRRRARILHVHGYAAADFGRVAARLAGCRLVLHEHFADPACRPTRGSPIACSRPGPTRPSPSAARRSSSSPVERHVPAGARAPDLERGAARRVPARATRAGAGAATRAGPAGRRARSRHHRPAERAEGTPAPARRRRPPAARPAVGAAARGGRRRPDGRPARTGPGAGHRASAVVFAGHRTDVADLLGALDVFCISSLYEGTPLALFEAMAAGKAIVSTSVDGCREVLAGGDDGAAGPARRPRGPRRRRSQRALVVAGPARGPRPQRAGRLAAATTWMPASARCSRSTRSCSPAGAAEMDARGLLRAAGEAWEVPRDLALRRYPAFVTGGALRRGEVPVFVFHGAEPRASRRKLDHLARQRLRHAFDRRVRGHHCAASARQPSGRCC